MYLDPSRILVAGDTHGCPQQMVYLWEMALEQNADVIVQVGDFGYWEHAEGGAEFLDGCSSLYEQTGIPLIWIDGNHENHPLLRRRYRKARQSIEGFWEIREGIYYCPRGTRWTWNDRRFMGLGGANSFDKELRLAQEQGKACTRFNWKATKPLGKGTQWWPEEELTDEEIAYALRDPEPLDVLFTHDKPRGAPEPTNDPRRVYPESWPNQDRIQTVVRTLRPALVIHGHLHIRYRAQIRSADDSWTTVEGLAHEMSNCLKRTNPETGKTKKIWRPSEDSWLVLNLETTSTRAPGEI